MNSDLVSMQSHLAAWDELVEQVRKGERAEEAVGLQDKQENLSKWWMVVCSE